MTILSLENSHQRAQQAVRKSMFLGALALEALEAQEGNLDHKEGIPGKGVEEVG